VFCVYILRLYSGGEPGEVGTSGASGAGSRAHLPEQNRGSRINIEQGAGSRLKFMLLGRVS